MNALRNMHPAKIAGIIAVLVLLWLLSGLFGEDEVEATAETRPPGQSLVKVEVLESRAQTITREAIVSGRTAPTRTVQVRAQTNGRIEEIVARRGALLEAGALIARIALDERQAQQRQAQAVLHQRRLQYQAAQRLRKDDYMTEVELAQSRANLQIAEAEAIRIEQDITHTQIRAPFSGVLEARPIEVGDYVKVGDELAFIIDQSSFIAIGQVTEDVVAHLEVGQPGKVQLVNDREIEGQIRFIASTADEQTRTYRVELEVPLEPGERFIAGATASLRLPLEEVLAHELEPSILTLDENGDFGLKSVTENDLVQFHKADIVRNTDGKIWLAGLPDKLRAITVGQGFVTAGDHVKVAASQTRGDYLSP